jgi:uncharacterized protein YcbK (DUF882 family)/peptidoglycan hydrolase-like protein with peptidoglycan-binding domain
MADSALFDRLRSAGIVNPRIMVAEATAVGLRLGVAAALLEKESRGGENLFGHDRDRKTQKYIFPARDGDVKVTKALYLEYRAKRDATGNCQGVGPCQLTAKFLQEAADKAGGCWRPTINMRIGFAHMASLMKQNGERTGARMYNGSGDAAEAYADDLLKKAARWESIIGGAKVPPAPRVLRLGDHGPLVEKLTRRLSFVPSKKTKAPYLNGARRKFDAATQAALKAFQREHGLDDDGRFGTLSARKLNRAVKREKLRRQHGGQVTPTPSVPVSHGTTTPVAHPGQQGSRLPALVARVRKLDEETDDAWASLVAYARRRRRLRDKLASKTDYQKAVVEALKHMTEILLRIEDKVEDIAEVEEHEEHAAHAQYAAEEIAKDTAALAQQTAAVAESVATGGGGGSGGGGEPPVPVVQAETIKPPPPEGPAPPSPSANGAAAAPPRRLSDLSEAELEHRVARLDAQMEKARAELYRRYALVDKQIARMQPPKKKGGGGKGTTKPGHGTVTGPVHGGSGKVVDTKLGDRGLFVRRSKLALAGYLKAKGNPEHVKLRRRLRRDARAPGKANLATVVWQEGVKAAQHIAARPVTGELDGELVRILQPFWPRDNAGKRAIRGTPGWRAIPGQLTPNFNIKEFACKDAAHTGYVEGLVREKNLTKKQAKQRAKDLAKRLERLRKLGGNRPVMITSAYRTEAYNATLKGAVPNSAHTRGYAVDTPAPQGVTLLQHEQHVLASFECGVGYYPPGMGNFIHGDFDPTLNHGQRRRWGPGRG